MASIEVSGILAESSNILGNSKTESVIIVFIYYFEEHN